MLDHSDRLFVGKCKHCRRTLVTTARISDPEIATIQKHVQACCTYEPLTDEVPLGELLRHVRVSAVPAT